MEDTTLSTSLLNMLETRFVKTDEWLSDLSDDTVENSTAIALLKEAHKTHIEGCPMNPIAIKEIVLDTIKLYNADEPERKLKKANAKMNLWFMALTIFIALCSLGVSLFAIFHTAPK